MCKGEEAVLENWLFLEKSQFTKHRMNQTLLHAKMEALDKKSKQV